MTEQGQENLSAGEFEEAGQVDDEFIPDDARPLCLKCLKPCHPLQHYCDSCDCNEVINPLASYIPFVRIRFAYGFFGKMWRIMWYDKETSTIFRLLCLFLIIFYAPILLIVGLPLFLNGKIPEPQLQRPTVAAFYIIAVFLWIIFIYFNLF
ncbi:MAG: hypothetical protein ACYSW7_05180 [Planctomycetota bacterium]|jgi:hypothetical protein